MKQCQAETNSSRRCRNAAKEGDRFCGRHGGVDGKRVAATGLGALLGHLVAPGIGGLIGGLAANLLDRAIVSEVERKKVYCAFDFDHDRQLKGLFIGQSKHSKSPFEVVDHSLLEAAPEARWKQHARDAIVDCDLVVILLGPHTHRAPGVRAEVAMARELGVRSVQLRRSWDRTSTPVPQGGRVIDWTWDNLKRELS